MSPQRVRFLFWTASFTIADESRYVDGISVRRDGVAEGLRWQLRAGWEHVRLGKIVETVCRILDLPCGAKPFQGASRRQRREHRDGAPSVRYLNRLALLDEPEQLARSLSKLPYAYRCHGLLVAQSHHASQQSLLLEASHCSHRIECGGRARLLRCWRSWQQPAEEAT